MVDYSDYEGWLDNALFDAMVIIRNGEFWENAAERKRMDEIVANIVELWTQVKANAEVSE